MILLNPSPDLSVKIDDLFKMQGVSVEHRKRFGIISWAWLAGSGLQVLQMAAQYQSHFLPEAAYDPSSGFQAKCVETIYIDDENLRNGLMCGLYSHHTVSTNDVQFNDHGIYDRPGHRVIFDENQIELFRALCKANQVPENMVDIFVAVFTPHEDPSFADL